MKRNELFKIYYIYIGLFVLTHIVNLISIRLIDGKIALITGVIWVVLTSIIYFFYIRKKDGLVIIYSIINAIFAGIVMSSYYSIKSVSPYNPLILMVVFAVMMLSNFIVFRKIERKEIFARNNIIAAIILIIISVIIWISYDKPIGSSFVFLNAIYLCYNIALYRYTNKSQINIRILGSASVLMFAGILFFVIQALSEGEGLEIFADCCTGTSNRKKTK
ncbi:MAG: hypothetical protein GX236_12495 [Clostridiaceae bacterium]|nr:hypothetical protein [Clostridiaceae bacterium]